MKLYILVSRKQVDSNACMLSLQAACVQKSVDSEIIVAEDTSLESLRSRIFEPHSLLYRVSTGSKSRAIESMLMHLYPQTFTTIIVPHTISTTQTAFQEVINDLRTGVGIIPTKFVDETWRQLSAELLETEVADLGGFPVIFKQLGLSHGKGVERIASAPELYAKIQESDFDNHTHMLRKYLDKHRNFRIIVVDGEVVAAIEYYQPANDFRTNAAHDLTFAPLVLSEIDPQILDMSIRAVANRSSLMGGVDILIDTDNIPYIAEENVPCNFARAEEPTGVPVGLLILEAMIRRQQAGVA
jgi:hypothetical protein